MTRKAKTTTGSKPFAPAKRTSEVIEAAERFEDAKNAVLSTKKNMEEWLAVVKKLENELRVASRHLSDAQGILAYNEDKLERVRSELESCSYINMPKCGDYAWNRIGTGVSCEAKVQY